MLPSVVINDCYAKIGGLEVLNRCETVPKSTCPCYSSYRQFLLSTCSVYRQNPFLERGPVFLNPRCSEPMSCWAWLTILSLKYGLRHVRCAGTVSARSIQSFCTKKTVDKPSFCPISVANGLKVRPHKSKNQIKMLRPEKIPSLFCFLIPSFC